ncbi:MAG: orotidine-5'-phosphate decarboxylase, partial [bacterium]
FTACGAESVDLVKSYGCKVFLDLKYHDIPNTVYKAVKSAGKLGADIINVHASGGMDMMKAAKMGAEEASFAAGRHIDVIAVTVLTSLSDADVQQIFYGFEKPPVSRDLALHLAELAKTSGLDGVVCSGHESLEIKNTLGQNFKTVTPGIRLKAKNTEKTAGIKRLNDDQKRVMSPSEAFNAGADYIVVGREITGAENPADALADIYSDIENNININTSYK